MTINARTQYDFSILEGFMEDFGMAEAAEALGVSLKWKFGMRAIATIAALRRTSDPEDPTFGQLTKKELSERIRQMEHRLEETLELLSWVEPIACRAQYDVSVDVLIQKAQVPRQVASLMDEEDYRKACGLDSARYAEAKQKAQGRAAQLAQPQINAVSSNEKEIRMRLNTALKSQTSLATHVELRTALSILSTMAEKAADYQLQRTANGLRTRRPRRQAKLAAEANLLGGLYERIEDEIERVERDVEAEQAATTVHDTEAVRDGERTDDFHGEAERHAAES